MLGRPVAAKELTGRLAATRGPRLTQPAARTGNPVHPSGRTG